MKYYIWQNNHAQEVLEEEYYTHASTDKITLDIQDYSRMDKNGGLYQLDAFYVGTFGKTNVAQPYSLFYIEEVIAATNGGDDGIAYDNSKNMQEYFETYNDLIIRRIELVIMIDNKVAAVG